VIYKKATGRYFVSSYGSRRIHIRAPAPLRSPAQRAEGPLFLVADPAARDRGMCVACGWARRWLVATIVILAAETYLIASWFDWQFGASYGHRGFVDALPVLALFMAAFLDWASARPRLTPVIGVALTIAVLLSVAQMIQYWSGTCDRGHDVGSIQAGCPAVPMTRPSSDAGHRALGRSSSLPPCISTIHRGWANLTFGLREWENDPRACDSAGRRGPGTFFIPSDAATMTLPLRSFFPASIEHRSSSPCWWTIDGSPTADADRSSGVDASRAADPAAAHEPALSARGRARRPDRGVLQLRRAARGRRAQRTALEAHFACVCIRSATKTRKHEINHPFLSCFRGSKVWKTL